MQATSLAAHKLNQAETAQAHTQKHKLYYYAAAVKLLLQQQQAIHANLTMNAETVRLSYKMQHTHYNKTHKLHETTLSSYTTHALTSEERAITATIQQCMQAAPHNNYSLQTT